MWPFAQFLLFSFSTGTRLISFLPIFVFLVLLRGGGKDPSSLPNHVGAKQHHVLITRWRACYLGGLVSYTWCASGICASLGTRMSL